MTTPLGIIAGTGFYDLDALEDPVVETVETARESVEFKVPRVLREEA